MRGAVVFCTGLPASGKKTTARAAAALLNGLGMETEVLDGMTIRKEFWPEIGFKKEDKDENVRRLGRLAARFERHGVVALIAAIAPYAAIRDEVRKMARTFVEVFILCPRDICHKRDPRGLYDGAFAGRIKNVPGVDDPYEVPPYPEVVVHTDQLSPEQGAEKILEGLRMKGAAPPPRS